MSEVTLKGNKQIPNKPKKKASGAKVALIVLLSVFIGIPAILVGTVFACFYDGTQAGAKGKDGYSTQEVFNQVVVDAFDNTVSDHEIQIRLTEENINQFLYNALNNAGPLKGTVKNLYVDITDSHYIFVMEANVFNFFKTRVFVTTEMTIDEENITFEVNDIKIGRIGGFKKAITWATSTLSLGDMSAAFAESGIHMTVDLPNLRLIYKITDFYNDFSKMIKADDSYLAILREMVSNTSVRTFHPVKNKALECDINLDELRIDDTVIPISSYTVPMGYISETQEYAKSSVVTALNSGIISLDKTTVVAKYYSLGYDKLKSDEKTIISDYLSHGLTPVDTTKTYDPTVMSQDTLEEIFDNQIASQITVDPNHLSLEATTTQLDKMFKQSTIIGNTMGVSRKASEGSHKCALVTFSRVSTVIIESKLYIIVSVNVNGYEINFSISTSKDNTYHSFGSFRFKFEDMYIGRHVISEESKTALMSLFEESITQAAFSDNVHFNKIGNDYYVIFSFVNQLGDYSIVEATYDTDLALVNNTVSTPGRLKLLVNKK